MKISYQEIGTKLKLNIDNKVPFVQRVRGTPAVHKLSEIEQRKPFSVSPLPVQNTSPTPEEKGTFVEKVKSRSPSPVTGLESAAEWAMC